MTPTLQLLRRWVRSRALNRGLLRQLTRIADALERAYPPPPPPRPRQAPIDPRTAVSEYDPETDWRREMEEEIARELEEGR